MERGPAMYDSLRAGKPVEVVEEPTLADSLGGGIGLDNAYTFEITRKLIDETALLSEAEIAAATVLKGEGELAFNWPDSHSSLAYVEHTSEGLVHGSAG